MTVLAGCRTPEQVTHNAAASGWELSAEEIDRIGRIIF
jgi:aryl-alcohol dehydrogenase-like predicted oxidoreductase